LGAPHLNPYPTPVRVTSTAPTTHTCRHYHASLSPDEREEVQRQWSLDRVQVSTALFLLLFWRGKPFPPPPQAAS